MVFARGEARAVWSRSISFLIGTIAVGRSAYIGHVHHKSADAMAELPLDILERCRGVFDGVMQPGSSDDLLVVGDHGDQVSYCFQVDIVGLKRIFPAAGLSVRGR